MPQHIRVFSIGLLVAAILLPFLITLPTKASNISNGGGAGGGLTSVGLSMPSAFTVTGSPLIANGTIAVTGVGVASQYIGGDGSLNTAVVDPGANGFVVRTGAGTTVARSLGAVGPIGVSNGDGQAGNPSIFCNNCVTASSGLTTFAVLVGQGVRASTAIAVDSTPTHALFATGSNPTFRAITSADLPPVSIASGTTAMPTISVPGNGCSATATTAVATGALGSDRVAVSYNGDPTGLVGYGGGGSEVDIKAWTTANQVNFKLCNGSAAAVTPGAASVNWGITR